MRDESGREPWEGVRAMDDVAAWRVREQIDFGWCSDSRRARGGRGKGGAAEEGRAEEDGVQMTRRGMIVSAGE